MEGRGEDEGERQVEGKNHEGRKIGREWEGEEYAGRGDVEGREREWEWRRK